MSLSLVSSTLRKSITLVFTRKCFSSNRFGWCCSQFGHTFGLNRVSVRRVNLLPGNSYSHSLHRHATFRFFCLGGSKVPISPSSLTGTSSSVIPCTSVGATNFVTSAFLLSGLPLIQ